MIQLNRQIIRALASSELTYSRGIRCFRNGNVRRMSTERLTGKIRVEVVDSVEYTVMLSEENGEVGFSCNCAGSLKEKGACKHAIAALFAVMRRQEKSRFAQIESPEDRRACMCIDHFRSTQDSVSAVEVFHLEPIITVPQMFSDNESRCYLSVKVGKDRLYKVQNLKRFVSDYLSHEDILLGKDVKFVWWESEFDKSSKEILDFIIEGYELLELGDDITGTRIFNRAMMTLSKNLLMRLLHSVGKYTFTLILGERVYENVRVFDKNPNIKYDLDIVDDAILLDYHDKEAVIPLMKSGELIYYNGAVFIPDARFRRNYAPFFNTLGTEKPPLIFRDDNKKRFLEEVLPRIGDLMDIDIPEELADRYISPELSCKIFFDRYQNGIKAQVRFVYADYEFSSFENPDSDHFIILRQREKEDDILSRLEDLGFEARTGFYLLKNESALYEFLISDKTVLTEVAQIYYSEDFKKLKVVSGGNFNVGLRVSSDMDLLQMEFSYGDMSPKELERLFRSLRVKKKYYRLENGSFINLMDDDFEKLAVIMDNLGVTSKNFTEGGIKLTKSNAFYLDGAFDRSGFSVTKSDDFINLIENISSEHEETYEIPKGINAQLREYQVRGFGWMMTLARNSLGGILADDMGLGKTLQTIVYIRAMLDGPEKQHPHFLIVCPSSIIYNWMDEFQSFAPDVRACVVTGVPEERKKLIDAYESVDVLITSYPLMRRDVGLYRKIVFGTVFLDEAQFIKNAASQSAQSVKLLSADHRFALTGTPIENSLSELWSIFDFIMPNFLMTHSKFATRYEKPIINGDKKVLENLNMRISPFIMRRMKKDVLKELPGKLEEKIVTPMSEEQRNVYLSYMNEIRGDLFGSIESVGFEGSKMKILAALTRLRQICCHPSTFLDNYKGGSGKLDLLMQQIDNAIANEHRTLVFSQFTGMLEIIGRELKEKGINYFYLDGSTPPEERLDMAKRFNGGENDIFLISLKAGGTGLNLIGADTVIHYDPWWNPAVEDQATDRAYRIGQTQNVYVLKLLTKGTIEEKIYKLQQKKKELSDSCLTGGEVFLGKLTREELEDIFSFD